MAEVYRFSTPLQTLAASQDGRRPCRNLVTEERPPRALRDGTKQRISVSPSIAVRAQMRRVVQLRFQTPVSFAKHRRGDHLQLNVPRMCRRKR